MKTHIIPAIRLTIALVLLTAVIYPLIVAGIATFVPGGGGGEKIRVNGRVVGYANVGQKFTQDRYFNGRHRLLIIMQPDRAAPTKEPQTPTT